MKNSFFPLGRTNSSSASLTKIVSSGLLFLTTGLLMVVPIASASSNTAPVLDASKSPTLATVNEDPGAPAGAVGTLVSSLVDFATPSGQVDNVTDVDSGALLGVAITAVDSNLTCYYSLNGGTTWTAVGAVSSSSARLLAADSDNRLYCQPAQDLNGTFASALTFRAWDQTTGTDGGTASTASSGGTTAFSAVTDSIGLSVTAVNDAPVATNLSAAETYTEDTNLNLIDIVVSDVDNTTTTATLTLSNPAVGSLTTATSGAVTSTYNPGTGTWTASGAIADVNTLLAGVTFVPTLNYNGSFTIATSVSDGIAAAVTGSKAVIGIAVNDAPTATNLSAAETYTSNTPLDLTNIVVSDVDSASVTATLTLSDTAAGTLSTATSGSVTSTFSSGVWTASGAIASVNTLLAGVTFTSANGYSSNFTIATSVSDGIAAAVTGTKAMTGIASSNNAPVLDASKSPTMSNVAQDADAPVGAVGTPVTSLVDFATPSGQVDNVTDSDAGALLGIAITAVDSTNLTCYYTLDNGAHWTAIGAVSSTNARLLAANSNDRIYCKPTPSFNGTVADALTFKAWDQTSGTDGSLTSTASSGGTTAFSVATDSISLTVNPANNAPVLDVSASPILNTVNEDPGAPIGPVGTPVTSLADSAGVLGGLDNVTDVDDGALFGVAVTAVDTTDLTCYYTLDDGNSWTAMGTVSSASALLLAADSNHRIYCKPGANLNGTFSSAITFRAWDQTSGTDGSTANTSTSGGSSAFSTLTDTASLSVTPVQDPPVAHDDEYTVTENSDTTTLNVYSNDSNVDDLNVIIDSTSTPNHGGTASVSEDGLHIDYKPAPGFIGQETFTYELIYMDLYTSTATVTINVNDVVTAVDDTYMLRENSSATSFDVLANDTDAGEDALSLVSVTTPDHGTASLSSHNTKIDYTPGIDYCGPDLFNYTVTNTHGQTAQGIVNVTVACTHDLFGVSGGNPSSLPAIWGPFATIPKITLTSNDGAEFSNSSETFDIMLDFDYAGAKLGGFLADDLTVGGTCNPTGVSSVVYHSDTEVYVTVTGSGSGHCPAASTITIEGMRFHVTNAIAAPGPSPFILVDNLTTSPGSPVQTTDIGDLSIDPLALTNVTVDQNNKHPSATTTATFNFTTPVDLDVNPDDQMKFSFPSGYDLSSVTSSSGSCVDMTGTITTTVSGQNVILSRGGESSIYPSGDVTCSISGVINPSLTGPKTLFNVYLLDSTSGLAKAQGATTGRIEIGTPGPVFTNVTPLSNSTMNSVTSFSDVGYTLDSNVTSGMITIRVSEGSHVPDPGAPHICTLVGTAKQAGAHVIDLSNNLNGCVPIINLVNGASYDFTFSAINSDRNPSDNVIRTNVLYDTSVVNSHENGGGNNGNGNSGGGVVILYGCKDPAALNYNKNDGVVAANSQCTYGVSNTTTQITQETSAVTTSNPTSHSSASDTQSSSGAGKFLFTKNLRKPMVDPQVAMLQKFLDEHGFPVATTGLGSLDQLTNIFGAKTVAALKRLQASVNLPATGYFGPLTRAYVNGVLAKGL